MANIDLQTIVAPSLADSNFGASIKTQFENIDKNFKTLANWDFIRGRSGDSIHIESIAMVEADLAGTYDEWTPQWLYVQIANTVLIPGMTQAEQDAMLSTLDGGVVGVYYIQDGEDVSTKTYIGIEPYAFLDGRLSDPQWYEIPDDPDEQASLIEHPDGSCLVCTSYESDTVVFTKITAFPTIYYDNGVGQFCWKINGVESGIVARGPRGVDGLNGICPIVQVDKTNTSERILINGVYCYQIKHVIVDNQWVDMSNDDAIRIFDQLAKSSATQLCPCFVFDATEITSNTPVSSIYKFYLSYIQIDSGLYYVSCEDWQAISTDAVLQAIENESISKSYKNTTGILYNYLHKGVFVPFSPGMTSGSSATRYGGHIMFAISDSNSTPYEKLVIAPVKNLGNLGDGTSGTSTTPALLDDANMEVRYETVDFTIDAQRKVEISNDSVSDKFTELYTTDDHVPAETRFRYIWKTDKPDGATWDWPDENSATENRAAATSYTDHPFKAFICPDGFLWYKDPYTYLRVELKPTGQVAIIGPANGSAPTGRIVSPTSNENIVMTAGNSDKSFNVSADTYWQIS